MKKNIVLGLIAAMGLLGSPCADAREDLHGRVLALCQSDSTAGAQPEFTATIAYSKGGPFDPLMHTVEVTDEPSHRMLVSLYGDAVSPHSGAVLIDQVSGTPLLGDHHAFLFEPKTNRAELYLGDEFERVQFSCQASQRPRCPLRKCERGVDPLTRCCID